MELRRLVYYKGGVSDSIFVTASCGNIKYGFLLIWWGNGFLLNSLLLCISLVIFFLL